MEDEITYLLKTVHAYYSIGVPGFRDYPGQVKLMQILEQKINSIINEEQTSWSALVPSVQATFPKNRIVDLGHRQFPNFHLKVELKKNSLDGIQLSSELNLVISGLCNRYTLFIEDSFTFTQYKIDAEIQEIPQFRIISLEDHSLYDELKNPFEPLKQSIEISFPGYQFIRHSPLLQVLIEGGLPYSLGPESGYSHPLYSFLFDGFFSYKDMKVLR